MQQKEIEILAPAGSYDSMVASIHAGADAVYIGGSKFGARAFANNLETKDLIKAIDFVHLHKKKLYLTVNTLFKNNELEEELFDYLEPLYTAGLDAVIVQDVGVMKYIHTNFLHIPIHASTQMTLTSEKGLNLLSDMGVTRIVTSRELNLSEIKQIRENTSLEIESFVHGALCYCYSGQCLMSSMIGTRSGNRGRCAQPCRMPYQLKKGQQKAKEESYLLSPKDICTLEIIPQLVESGINSFKIEGRMKRPEYTALVVSKYKKYRDLYLELGNEKYKEYIIKKEKELETDIRELMDLYNRGGFTEGYYKNQNGSSMMSIKRPNHNGVFVGTVLSTKKNTATIQLEQDIYSQDILEIRKEAQVIYEYTVKNPAKRKESVLTNFLPNSGVSKGQSVYRTKNQSLLEDIQTKYMKNSKKEKIKGKFIAKVGEKILLIFERDETKVEVFGEIAEKAIKQASEENQIRKQLNKTNTTQFEFETLEILIEDNVFLPNSHLNELRRNAMEELEKQILLPFKREHPIKKLEQPSLINKEHSMKKETKTGIIVHLTDTRLLDMILESKEVDKIYLNLSYIEFSSILSLSLKIKEKGKQFYLVFPYIFRKQTSDSFKKLDLHFLKEVDGFVVKNFEELGFLMEELNISKDRIRLDYNVYTANKESKEFYKEKGICNFTSSVELNNSEQKLVGCEDCDFIVYGHIPVMVSAQCVYKTIGECKKKDSLLWEDFLVDRYHKKFYVKSCCKYCYNVIYNGEPISLLKNKKELEELNPENIRLDFTMESEKEAAKILEAFIDVFRYHKKTTYEINDYTKGHFKRGVD